MEVKVIMEERRDNFEEEIKKYLELGYKIQGNNIIQINSIDNTMKSIVKDWEKVITKESIKKFCFYALMIKE